MILWIILIILAIFVISFFVWAYWKYLTESEDEIQSDNSFSGRLFRKVKDCCSRIGGGR